MDEDVRKFASLITELEVTDESAGLIDQIREALQIPDEAGGPESHEIWPAVVAQFEQMRQAAMQDAATEPAAQQSTTTFRYDDPDFVEDQAALMWLASRLDQIGVAYAFEDHAFAMTVPSDKYDQVMAIAAELDGKRTEVDRERKTLREMCGRIRDTYASDDTVRRAVDKIIRDDIKSITIDDLGTRAINDIMSRCRAVGDAAATRAARSGANTSECDRLVAALGALTPAEKRIIEATTDCIAAVNTIRKQRHAAEQRRAAELAESAESRCRLLVEPIVENDDSMIDWNFARGIAPDFAASDCFERARASVISTCLANHPGDAADAERLRAAATLQEAIARCTAYRAQRPAAPAPSAAMPIGRPTMPAAPTVRVQRIDPASYDDDGVASGDEDRDHGNDHENVRSLADELMQQQQQQQTAPEPVQEFVMPDSGDEEIFLDAVTGQDDEDMKRRKAAIRKLINDVLAMNPSVSVQRKHMSRYEKMSSASVERFLTYRVLELLSQGQVSTAERLLRTFIGEWDGQAYRVNEKLNIGIYPLNRWVSEVAPILLGKIRFIRQAARRPTDMAASYASYAQMRHRVHAVSSGSMSHRRPSACRTTTSRCGNSRQQPACHVQQLAGHRLRRPSACRPVKACQPAQCWDMPLQRRASQRHCASQRRASQRRGSQRRASQRCGKSSGQRRCSSRQRRCSRR